MKGCYCFTKSMYFKNMLWHVLMIASFKKHFHWSSTKQWMHWPLFPVPKYHPVRCFKLSFYCTGLCPVRSMKEANTGWLKWISRKHQQTWALWVFSFLVLKLVQKAVLHYARLYKSALRNKQLIISNAGKSFKH